MKISARLKKPLLTLAVIALLIWCVMDINWSSLTRFSWGSFTATLSRICQPEWGDFYNGTSEDIFHLMLVTIAIGFFGTTVGTVLAIPFTLLASANLWNNRVVPRVGKFILRTCVESIYRRSTYEDLEIIVIENNSREPATFRCYERLQKEHRNLRVITWQGTGFNYSALNNFGAREATGEYLLLLNNDTEVISPRWIEEMLMYAQQDRVGCVGAKLLYPDNTIQHAGIGFGFLTLAAHMHKNFPVGHPGYMGRLVYAQDVYAVTAACLMVRKSVYEQVNGLDESFAVAFNDVDFCVRVREAGYTNVFTPFAQLYHYESKSRGLDENPVKRKRFISEVERFQKRWAKQLAAGDPCMNPNFDLMKEDFSFDIKPLE